MDISKDAYGQEVWAFFLKKDSYEVVERDDGFIGLSGSAPAYFAEFKDWLKIEKQAIKLAKGKILDIGAGAGRVSLYLQKNGHDVIAIDNSPLTIKVCKKRGVKHADGKLKSSLIQTSLFTLLLSKKNERLPEKTLFLLCL